MRKKAQLGGITAMFPAFFLVLLISFLFVVLALILAPLGPGENTAAIEIEFVDYGDFIGFQTIEVNEDKMLVYDALKIYLDEKITEEELRESLKGLENDNTCYFLRHNFGFEVRSEFSSEKEPAEEISEPFYIEGYIDDFQSYYGGCR